MIDKIQSIRNPLCDNLFWIFFWKKTKTTLHTKNSKEDFNPNFSQFLPKLDVKIPKLDVIFKNQIWLHFTFNVDSLFSLVFWTDFSQIDGSGPTHQIALMLGEVIHVGYAAHVCVSIQGHQSDNQATNRQRQVTQDGPINLASE